MPAKLTQREKNARRTAQRCRAVEARSLATIQQEIRELEQIITDMNFNLSLAMKSVKADGIFVELVVTDSNGAFQKTKKLNPAFKIQKEALNALKSLKRQLVLLREEQTQAQDKEKLADRFREFERQTEEDE